MDELDRRVRSLEAERLRPVPQRRWRPDPRKAAPPDRIATLLAEFAQADGRSDAVRGPADDRHEDYAFLREQGESIEEAAVRVGVKPAVARKHYEPHLKETSA